MHLRRLIVAVILLPFLFFFIMYLPSQYFLVLLFFASSIALIEFFSMSGISGITKYTCLLLGTAILGISYFSRELLLGMIVISLITIMGVRLFLKKDPHLSLRDVSVPILALIYIPVFLTFQIQIRKFGPEWIIFLYALVWVSDSMAYYAGKGFGKRRLYTAVSPNKTIAGAIGSLFGGALCSLFLSFTLIPVLTASTSLLIGILIGGISIVGDLVESMFKRDAGVKDSGAIIPGHGGILDKIDGLLLGGPMLYYILLSIGIP